MNIAVVILNWNGKDLLKRFLPSVISNSYKAELIIIDNASTDSSISFIEQNYPQISIIKNKKNYGFTKGYNEGLKYVSADVLCLLNSDVETTPNWLTPIIHIFENQPDTAIIQPKILDYKHQNTFEYAGAGGGLLDFFGYPYCRGRRLSKIKKDVGQYDDNSTIFWASGACFFIRQSAFDNLGGFDEDYFAYQEEIDLCWRAHHKNYIVQYAGSSTVYHLGSQSFGKESPQKTFLNFRNSLISITKNLPDSRVYFIVFSRLILDGITAIMFLLKRKPKHTKAIVKAHFSYYKTLQKTIKKRKSINKRCFKYYNTFSILLNALINRKF